MISDKATAQDDSSDLPIGIAPGPTVTHSLREMARLIAKEIASYQNAEQQEGIDTSALRTEQLRSLRHQVDKLTAEWHKRETLIVTLMRQNASYVQENLKLHHQADQLTREHDVYANRALGLATENNSNLRLLTSMHNDLLKTNKHAEEETNRAEYFKSARGAALADIKDLKAELNKLRKDHQDLTDKHSTLLSKWVRARRGLTNARFDAATYAGKPDSRKRSLYWALLGVAHTLELTHVVEDIPSGQ